jgi:hypothetical protein
VSCEKFGVAICLSRLLNLVTFQNLEEETLKLLYIDIYNLGVG